jgi:hypothetical protein
MANKAQMADITIGGKMPAALLEEFLGELNSTGAMVGGHDSEKFCATTAQQLRKVLDDNGHLLLVADKFDELEGFCVRHGIAFDRRGTVGNICFRAGMSHPTSPDTGGDALLDADNIRPVAKELARLVTVKLTKEKLLAATVKVIRHLHGLLPPEIAPLPPLDIEE